MKNRPLLYASVSNDFIWLGLAKSVDPEMVERAAEKISSKVGKLRKKRKMKTSPKMRMTRRNRLRINQWKSADFFKIYLTCSVFYHILFGPSSKWINSWVGSIIQVEHHLE